MNKYKLIIIVIAYLFSGASHSDLSDYDKRKASASFSKTLAATQVENLAKFELETSSLGIKDRELVVFSAAGFLNAKLEKLSNLKTANGEYTQQQKAHAISIALRRLSLLAQISGLHEIAICHLAESKVLEAISQDKNMEPANCRHRVYSSEVQSLQISTSLTPEGDVLSNLANNWATSASLYAYNVADIEQFVAFSRTTPPLKKPVTNSICENEIQVVKGFPMEMQEATLLRASSSILNKFMEVNLQESAKPEDRLWGFKILSIGNLILKNTSIGSPRVKSVLGGFSETATQAIRGSIKLDKFTTQMGIYSEQAKSIDMENMNRKLKFIASHENDVSALSRCVLATAMINSNSK